MRTQIVSLVPAPSPATSIDEIDGVYVKITTITLMICVYQHERMRATETENLNILFGY